MNNIYELEYKKLLKDILINGERKDIRDGNSTLSLFGKSIEFNSITRLFPMLTSKKMYFKNVKCELSWILLGLTNVNYLKKHNVSIWDNWADENGDIGDTYGRQLRSFNGVDQLTNTIEELKRFKNSRQLVISLWNPVAILQGNLKPCYHSFQFLVHNNLLNICVSQRSADMFVGLPYDMAFFTLLLRLVSNHCNIQPGIIKINITDAHIYVDHIDGVKKYLNTEEYDLPALYFIRQENRVIGFDIGNVSLKRYKCEEFIPAKIIV